MDNNQGPLLSGSYNGISFNCSSIKTLLDIGIPSDYIDTLIFEYYKNYLTSLIQNKINEVLTQYEYDSQSQLVVYAVSEFSPYYDEANRIVRWIYEAWHRWENINPNQLKSQQNAKDWFLTNMPVF